MNQSAKVSAETILNTYESEALALVFYKYSDLKKVRFIVQNILQAREAKALQTTGDLIAAIAPLAPKFKENKFYAQVFQAVRIEVNQEMEALESFLLQTNEVLKEKGRLVVMSYHSLEDRLVKNYVKRGSFKGEIEKDFFGNILKPYTEITRHPISPNEEELERNPRSRSAKLRIAQNNG
jgi:16S rRNA (cytosine1402-N4)-methyltransferase